MPTILLTSGIGGSPRRISHTGVLNTTLITDDSKKECDREADRGRMFEKQGDNCLRGTHSEALSHRDSLTFSESNNALALTISCPEAGEWCLRGDQRRSHERGGQYPRAEAKEHNIHVSDPSRQQPRSTGSHTEKHIHRKTNRPWDERQVGRVQFDQTE
ncbi:unnamed protein product [Fusarium venenatum]|uniref:Uncharacterized protein n=1 Tax=Fusarium venenatum TaxID=56646 RepID=A0A2L2TZ94_9HYPO|nr:uncharacterized protein FVRRES_03017 [Fusarium venenatum]CEI66505.1 unnamed protein product [Fusarium venenatum]